MAKYKFFVTGLATAFWCSAPISNAYANTDRMQIEVCNTDGDSNIFVAVVDEHALSLAAEGWMGVAPNSCQTLYRWTGSSTTHHVYFGAKGMGLLEFNFGSAFVGGQFCVSYPEDFSYGENFLTSGRAKNCRGTEKLARSRFKVSGRSGGKQQITIRPFSREKSVGDGKVCLFGFCL